MFYPLSRLSSEPDGHLKLLPTGRRSFRPSVIVPREICVFESLPAQGVAWHEMNGFADLQAKRLAPFVDSGANAVLKGKRLMFWFWDANEVDAALRAAGVEPGKLRKLAEPLMLPVSRQAGEHRLQCSAGVDTLILADGAIVASQWQEGRQAIPRPLPWLAAPWGRDRLGTRRPGLGAVGGASLAQRALAASAVVAVIAAGAQVAYWGSRLLAANERLAAQAEASSDASTALARVSELRGVERGHVAWLQRYAQLGASLDGPALLNALNAPLQAQGTVVKELEVQGSQLRLLLVAAGGDLNVPGVIKALDGMPGLRSIQLQQNPDATQASFLMDISSFRRPPAWDAPEARP